MTIAARRRAGWLFASPWLTGFMLLTLGPLLASLALSFCEWKGLDAGHLKWVGVDNYIRAWNDPKALRALTNTALYAVTAVPLGLTLALALALLLNQRLPGIPIFRTLFYMPNVISGVATVMMWSWVFSAQFGLLNAVLRSAARLLAGCGLAAATGWEPPNWLGDPNWTKPALVVMSLWGTGGAMLVFLSALQNVPDQLYEAARIDGATRWQQFRHITVPQISPAISFNLIMGVIGSLQVFNDAFILFSGGGGSDNSALFYVVYLYGKAFRDLEFGYASALAWVLFVIVLLLTLLVAKGSKRFVHEGGS